MMRRVLLLGLATGMAACNLGMEEDAGSASAAGRCYAAARACERSSSDPALCEELWLECDSLSDTGWSLPPVAAGGTLVGTGGASAGYGAVAGSEYTGGGIGGVAGGGIGGVAGGITGGFAGGGYGAVAGGGAMGGVGGGVAGGGGYGAVAGGGYGGGVAPNPEMCEAIGPCYDEVESCFLEGNEPWVCADLFIGCQTVRHECEGTGYLPTDYCAQLDRCWFDLDQCLVEYDPEGCYPIEDTCAELERACWGEPPDDPGLPACDSQIDDCWMVVNDCWMSSEDPTLCESEQEACVMLEEDCQGQGGYPGTGGMATGGMPATGGMATGGAVETGGMASGGAGTFSGTGGVDLY